MIKPGTMHKFFEDGDKSINRRFKTEHIVMDKKFVNHEQTMASFNPGGYREVFDLEPGTYVRLIDTETNSLLMSDTPMEIRTNREFIEEAHGDVFIAGLGIGLVLLSIQRKKEVETITVLEKYRELVEFIVPHLPLTHKIEIRFGDIFEWLPNDGEKFDTIYFDIWNSLCGDNYPETKDLHKRFRKYLNKKENPNSWMDSWRRDDFKELYFG